MCQGSYLQITESNSDWVGNMFLKGYWVNTWSPSLAAPQLGTRSPVTPGCSQAHTLGLAPQMSPCWPLSVGSSPLLFWKLNIEAATCHHSGFHTASSCQFSLGQVCCISFGGGSRPLAERGVGKAGICEFLKQGWLLNMGDPPGPGRGFRCQACKTKNPLQPGLGFYSFVQKTKTCAPHPRSAPRTGIGGMCAHWGRLCNGRERHGGDHQVCASHPSAPSGLSSNLWVLSHRGWIAAAVQPSKQTTSQHSAPKELSQPSCQSPGGIATRPHTFS